MSDRERESGDVHAWFLARLDAHATGMLTEVETERFAAHAAGCPACHEQMTSALASEVSSGSKLQHIPAGVLARWDVAGRMLRGLERHLVREHLESCATCREDLELLGFEPALPLDANLEDSAKAASHAPVSPGGTALRAPRPLRAPPFRRRPGHERWIARSGWVAAGAAAAVLVVLSMPRLTRGPLVLEFLEPASSFVPVTRGAAEHPTEIAITPGARFVQLVLPVIYLPDSTEVRLEVIPPDAGSAAVRTLRFADLYHERTLLLGAPDRPLALGDYRLVLTALTGSAGTDTLRRELAFRLIAPVPGSR